MKMAKRKKIKIELYERELNIIIAILEDVKENSCIDVNTLIDKLYKAELQSTFKQIKRNIIINRK